MRETATDKIPLWLYVFSCHVPGAVVHGRSSSRIIDKVLFKSDCITMRYFCNTGVNLGTGIESLTCK